MQTVKIAEELFADGLRARDCETWERVKKYDKKIADKIIQELYEIEVKHLMSIK